MSISVFDAHADTLTELYEKNKKLYDFDGMINAKMFDSFDAYVQIFAAWVNPEKENPLLVPISYADIFYKECEKNNLMVITDKEALCDVFENNKKGAILSIEGGSALCGDERCLFSLFRLGFRVLTLVWNNKNEICSSSADSEDFGLLPFGEKIIKIMNSLGMVIDVSHASSKTLKDVLRLSSAPIIASHSNAKAICPHIRNLSDEEIIAISKKGGVIGLNFYTLFLNGTDKAEISDVLKHAEHILSLGGEDCLGIGSDFDGISSAPENLKNAALLINLAEAFSRIGYRDELIKKIFYKNFCDVFKKILP